MADRYVVLDNDAAAERTGTERRWLREFGWSIVDTADNTIVASDGGEPEDQLLVRDWSWVVKSLNADEARIAALRAENAALKELLRGALSGGVRCERNGHLWGTDTFAAGVECPCATCARVAKALSKESGT